MDTCNAQSDTPLIVMVKSDQEPESVDRYEIRLESITNSNQHTLTLTFNRTEAQQDRLIIYEDFEIKFDLLDSNVYYVNSESEQICSIRYTGSEEILLNDYSRLEISSSDYYVRFTKMHYAESGSSLNPMNSEGIMIIVTLCSLLPFILEVPSALEDLQDALEIEASAFGTYGNIFRLFIPLMTVSLTFLLLQGLDFLR